MTSQLKRRGERGATAILVAQFSLVLVLFLVVSVRIGMLAVQSDEQQNQADALAFGANVIAMTQGAQQVCNHELLAFLAAGNRNREHGASTSLCPQPVREVQPDGSIRLRYRGEAEGAMDSEFGAKLLPDGDNPEGTVAEDGVSEIVELQYNQVDQRFPKLVLVLDYSGSMRSQFGGNRSRLDALKAAVGGLLDQRLKIEFGLVIFNDGIIGSVGIDRDDQQQDIRNAMARDAGGGTIYGGPLNKATELLRREEDTGYYVLFVSDGYPNDGDAPSLQAANRSRAAGVTIFTLNVGGGDAQRRLLTDMAGSQADPGNPQYYFSAGNDAQLQETFRQIVASILCTVGPLVVEPPEDSDPEDVHVFLNSSNGDEVPLPYSNDLTSRPQDPAYQYLPDEVKIRLSEAACNEVVERGATISIRFGPLRLVE